jgi:hypothetical protein
LLQEPKGLVLEYNGKGTTKTPPMASISSKSLVVFSNGALKLPPPSQRSYDAVYEKLGQERYEKKTPHDGIGGSASALGTRQVTTGIPLPRTNDESKCCSWAMAWDGVMDGWGRWCSTLDLGTMAELYVPMAAGVGIRRPTGHCGHRPPPKTLLINSWKWHQCSA